MDLLPDLRLGRAIGHRLTHHHLPLTLLEPAAAYEVCVAPHLDTRLPEPAHREVGSTGVGRAIENHHRDHFHGCQGLAVVPRGNAGLEFQVLKLTTCKEAHQLGIRPLAQHQHMQWIAGHRERAAQSVDQRQDGQQHRHRERDAQGRHDGGSLAHYQIPKIVGEWYGHSVNPCSAEPLRCWCARHSAPVPANLSSRSRRRSRYTPALPAVR